MSQLCFWIPYKKQTKKPQTNQPKVSLECGAVGTAGSETLPLENGNNTDICGKIDSEPNDMD